MKRFFAPVLVLAALGLSSASFAQSRPVKPSPMLTCRQISAPADRGLTVYATRDGVSFSVTGRATPVTGTYKDRVFTFQNGGWDDADFLSLVIREVNGRYVGVMYEPAASGPARYAETYFACAEIIHGGAISNGG